MKIAKYLSGEWGVRRGSLYEDWSFSCSLIVVQTWEVIHFSLYFFFFLKNRMDFEIFLYKISDFLLCQILWYLYFWPRLNLLILLLNPSNIRALTAAGPCSSAVSICRYYDHPTEKKNKCKHNCVSLKSKGYNWSNNGVRWY